MYTYVLGSGNNRWNLLNDQRVYVKCQLKTIHQSILFLSFHNSRMHIKWMKGKIISMGKKCYKPNKAKVWILSRLWLDYTSSSLFRLDRASEEEVGSCAAAPQAPGIFRLTNPATLCKKTIYSQDYHTVRWFATCYFHSYAFLLANIPTSRRSWKQ